jgi:glucokinase
MGQNRIGIEISGTRLRAVALGEDNAIAASRSAELDVDDPVAGLSAVIGELSREFGDVRRVGLAVPGLVDRSTGRISYSAHLPDTLVEDLAGRVKAAAGVDAVVENDANAAAYGEYRAGAGRGSRNLFYATLGQGVGGAFIFDGQIWRGASGFAGEFGYVPINSEGMKLEEVASSANIIRRTRSRFHQDSTSALNKLDEDAIDLAAIIGAAETDDDFAQMMLQRTGMYVGAAIASVINLLNPETIVVGGEIMQAKHLVLDAIVDRAREFAFAPSFESTRIAEAELGADSAAVGAALLSGEAGLEPPAK